MFCQNCGNQLEGTARFCPKCGTPVTSHNAPPSVKKKGYTWIAVLCAVIVLAAIGTGFGIYLFSRSNTGNSKSSYSDDRDRDKEDRDRDKDKYENKNEDEEIDKNNSWGNSKSTFVVHPDFRLSDGFIAKVEQQKSAPDGYIPISTAEEFDKIRLNTGANYILMADIDLSAIAWKDIDNFTGVLNGNGYTVSNASSSLFYEADGATIQNLGVYSNLSECEHGGGLIYTADDIVLDNCFFDGSITNDTTRSIGGLICTMNGGTVTNCYNKGTLNGGDCVGGIIAYALGSIFISNCFNEGSITGGSDENKGGCYCGGIIGESYHITGNIWYCYNSGSITCRPGYYFQYQNGYNLHYGSAVSSGIIGTASVDEGDWMYISMCYNSGTIAGGDIAFGICSAYGTSAERTRVHNCYNRGEFILYNSYGIAGCITGDGSFVRDIAIESCYNVSTTGAAAISSNSKNLLNCYYLDKIENATYDGALFSEESVQKLTADEMSKKASFNFDFDYVWQMGGRDYPYPVFGME